jgi:FtsZ-binding cell division protein ZapB
MNADERITILEATISALQEQTESLRKQTLLLREQIDALQRVKEDNLRLDEENRGWLKTYLSLLGDIDGLKAEISRLSSLAQSWRGGS